MSQWTRNGHVAESNRFDYCFNVQSYVCQEIDVQDIV